MKDAAFAAEAPAPPGAAGPANRAPHRFQPAGCVRARRQNRCPGRGQVEVKLPDNLTRYRVIAVAVAGGKEFGKGESTITARLPLMVRPSPPRFLNFGDRFELPVVLQNQTDTAMTVDVVVRGTNIALCQTFEVCETSKVSGSQVSELGQRVIVPADDRVEVRFPAETVSAGTARFQVAAAQQPGISQRPPGSDAAQFELPVWTPATTEAFAVYGELDKGAVAQPVIAPSNVFTQFGGLEISTSSTALQALTDAVLYLVAYPFECSEQLASRILAVAALRDVHDGVPGRGSAAAQGDRRGGGPRHRPAPDHAERRWRLADVAPGRGVVAVSQHPRGQRPAARKAEGLRRSPGERSTKPWATCATSSAPTPPSTLRMCGRRSPPTR